MVMGQAGWLLSILDTGWVGVGVGSRTGAPIGIGVEVVVVRVTVGCSTQHVFTRVSVARGFGASELDLASSSYSG